MNFADFSSVILLANNVPTPPNHIPFKYYVQHTMYLLVKDNDL